MKYHYILTGTLHLKDTTCIQPPKIHHVILRLCHNANIHYAIINLFLRLLNLCLNKAQDYYNLKCLKSIYFQTSDLQERTKEFTTFLYKEKIYKNNMWYTDEQIISALNKTSFRNDLNNMLRKYGIKCNCFNCDGLALVQTRKDILQEYLYDPNINILVIVPIVAHISSIK